METLSMAICGVVLFVAIYGLMGLLFRPNIPKEFQLKDRSQNSRITTDQAG